jgi:hypothetical protein
MWAVLSRRRTALPTPASFAHDLVHLLFVEA